MGLNLLGLLAPHDLVVHGLVVIGRKVLVALEGGQVRVSAHWVFRFAQIQVLLLSRGAQRIVGAIHRHSFLHGFAQRQVVVLRVQVQSLLFVGALFVRFLRIPERELLSELCIVACAIGDCSYLHAVVQLVVKGGVQLHLELQLVFKLAFSLHFVVVLFLRDWL